MPAPPLKEVKFISAYLINLFGVFILSYLLVFIRCQYSHSFSRIRTLGFIQVKNCPKPLFSVPSIHSIHIQGTSIFPPTNSWPHFCGPCFQISTSIIMSQMSKFCVIESLQRSPIRVSDFRSVQLFQPFKDQVYSISINF